MAKKESNLTLGISEPEKVDEFMVTLKHPMKDLVGYLRKVVLTTDKQIGEGVYWNAPTFFFTGKMKPFEAKEYKRFITAFVFNKPDCIRMIFLQGAAVAGKFSSLEGDFKDGRRLIVFNSLADAKSKEKELKSIIKNLISLMK